MQARASSWTDVESIWKPSIDDVQGGYEGLRHALLAYLAEHGVGTEGFSHYGIVVRDVDAALARLREARGGIAWEPAKRDHVEAFRVIVARGDLEGTELEFIQPVGESFFSTFLQERGEGLHHLSFRVSDLQKCFQQLTLLGVRFVGDGIRQGSHGSIAFAWPAAGAPPIFLELCQPRDAH